MICYGGPCDGREVDVNDSVDAVLFPFLPESSHVEIRESTPGEFMMQHTYRYLVRDGRLVFDYDSTRSS